MKKNKPFSHLSPSSSRQNEIMIQTLKDSSWKGWSPILSKAIDLLNNYPIYGIVSPSHPYIVDRPKVRAKMMEFRLYFGQSIDQTFSTSQLFPGCAVVTNNSIFLLAHKVKSCILLLLHVGCGTAVLLLGSAWLCSTCLFLFWNLGQRRSLNLEHAVLVAEREQLSQNHMKILNALLECGQAWNPWGRDYSPPQEGPQFMCPWVRTDASPSHRESCLWTGTRTQSTTSSLLLSAFIKQNILTSPPKKML